MFAGWKKSLTGLALSLVVTAAVVLAPTAAFAYPGDPWDDLPNSDWDQCQTNGTTGAGAQVCARLAVDNRGNVGGVEHYHYLLGLWDAKSDGRCAHAVWERTYQDGYVETHYGMYTCGLYSYWSATFETYSTWGHGTVTKERIGCFVDGGSVWWAWLYPW